MININEIFDDMLHEIFENNFYTVIDVDDDDPVLVVHIEFAEINKLETAIDMIKMSLGVKVGDL